MAKTRTKPADDRRADLLDAGARVFSERSVAATSVADVTTAAGVAKGTFYLYFPSKEALLGALQERFIDASLERLDAALAQQRPGDWVGRLDAYVAAFLEIFLEQGKLHDVLFHHISRQASVSAHRARDRVVQSIRRLLEDGAAAGAFSAADSSATAELLYSSLHGTADAALHHEGPVDPDRLIAAAQQFARRAIGATADRPGEGLEVSPVTAADDTASNPQSTRSDGGE